MMEDSVQSPAISAPGKGKAAIEIAIPEQSARVDVDYHKEKIVRTPGLKIFDIFLYPLLTNFVVFGVSVAATYLTSKGGERNQAGKLIYGKVGKFMQERGKWLQEKFMHTGMTENQADMAKMVAFSFVDGSLMSPVVKVFEDHREHIGRAIDVKLGTVPKDDSVYSAEPKHSWSSILGGRLATVSIVVPTAVALDKTGLNDKLFTKPGLQVGHYLAKKPSVAKLLSKYDIPELGRIGAFEAFYTSVCTAGIYLISRFIARSLDHKEKKHEQSDAPLPVRADSMQVPAIETQGKMFSQNIKRETKTPGMSALSFSQRFDAEPSVDLSRA